MVVWPEGRIDDDAPVGRHQVRCDLPVGDRVPTRWVNFRHEKWQRDGHPNHLIGSRESRVKTLKTIMTLLVILFTLK